MILNKKFLPLAGTHMTLTEHNYILVNNSDNNIDVYTLESKLITTININKKGLVCSKITNKILLVACKDFSVHEIS
jgi:hypothetical protein